MPNDRPILAVRSLSRRFPNQERAALSNVSFAVHEGEFIVVSGANGSGKSVLMRLIASLDRPSSGEIELSRPDGKDVRVGLVFQDADAQILGDTPEEDVAFGPRNLGLDARACEEASIRALREVGLEGRSKALARTLSGGEKRRLAVAGVLAMDADVIVFDEPYANLDWNGVSQVNSCLGDLKSRGKTTLVLTHELEKALALADRLLVLNRGELAYDGSPDEALRSAPLAEWGIRNPICSYAGIRDLLW
jgi:biotin transport system ATP-binding protein